MSEKRLGTARLSTARLVALWFAASVSLAELATGGLLSGAGLWRGMAASLAGHAAGAMLFFGAALLSFKKGKKAIAVCEDCYGVVGPRLFGAINVAQLVGWTAVMILAGARSLESAVPGLVPGGELAWRIALGALIVTWTLRGPAGIGTINSLAALLLAALGAVLSLLVLRRLGGLSAAMAIPAPTEVAMGFGTAFELAIIMPLSWLPLVGDYIVDARKGLSASIVSALSYGVGSLWMYAIGAASVLAVGTADPVAVFGGAWRAAALAVVLLSTVTTAFLDSYSAGVSLATALPRLGEKRAIALATIAGAALGIVAPVDRYESFLLIIGSVFAPFYAVLFADALLRGGPSRRSEERRGVAAFAAWALGVGLYHAVSGGALGLRLDALGATLPVMAIVGLGYGIYLKGIKA